MRCTADLPEAIDPPSNGLVQFKQQGIQSVRLGFLLVSIQSREFLKPLSNAALKFCLDVVLIHAVHEVSQFVESLLSALLSGDWVRPDFRNRIRAPSGE